MVVAARDAVAGQYFRNGADGIFECPDVLGAFLVQRNPDEGGHAEPQLFDVDIGPVAADDTIVFQPFHAPPAGRRRERNALGQFGAGQASIGLQSGQNLHVCRVEILVLHDLSKKSV